MTFSDFPALDTYTMNTAQVPCRVQSSAQQAPSVRCGPVKLRGGSRTGRFDLAHGFSAYFATSPKTTLRESVYGQSLLELA